MKKIILLGLSLLLISAVIYLGFSFQKKEQQKILVQSQIQTVPDFAIPDLGGTLVNLKEIVADKPSLLVYFNSTCEICQLELNSIAKRIGEFDPYRLIFVTVQPPEEVSDFIQELGISNRESVHFLIDSEMKVAGHFGIKGVPALFIYDPAGRLLGNYTGPVKVDLILDKLQNGEKL
jgi:peroxiredoxin